MGQWEVLRLGISRVERLRPGCALYAVIWERGVRAVGERRMRRRVTFGLHGQGTQPLLNSGRLPGGRLRIWDKIVGEVHFQGLPFGPSSSSFQAFMGLMVPEARCYSPPRS